MAERVQLPIGRMIWGNPSQPRIKKDQQKQVVLKDGKPVEQWVFLYAIPEANFGPVWQAMSKEAATLYGQNVPPAFSWKYKDGTRGIARDGKPLNTREGWNGHYVLTISTETQAPPVYKWDGRQYVQMQPGEFKTGDFFMATVDFVANKPTNPAHTPGLFVNPQALLWVAYGEPILSGADPEELFGAAPPQFQLPPGASLTPIGPPPGAPGMPGMAPSPGMPGQPPMQPGYPPQQPQMPGYPPQQPGYGAPPAAPGYPPQQPQMPGYPPQQAAPPPGPPPYTPAYDFARPGPTVPGVPPGYPAQPAPGYPQQPGYPPQQPQMPGYPPQMPGMPIPR